MEDVVEKVLEKEEERKEEEVVVVEDDSQLVEVAVEEQGGSSEEKNGPVKEAAEIEEVEMTQEDEQEEKSSEVVSEAVSDVSKEESVVTVVQTENDLNNFETAAGAGEEKSSDLVNGTDVTEEEVPIEKDVAEKGEVEDPPEVAATDEAVVVDARAVELGRLRERLDEVRPAGSFDPKSGAGERLYSREELLLINSIVQLVEYTREDVKAALKELADVSCAPGHRTKEYRADNIQFRPPRYDTTLRGRDRFTPTFVGMPQAMNQPSRPPPYMGRYSDRQKQKARPVIRPSIEMKDVELKRIDNAWKPGSKQSAEDKQNIDPAEILKSSVRGLLNKIAPTTFDVLKEDFLKLLQENTHEQWEVVIDVMFDKAVEEGGFCKIYSDLCKVVVDKELSETGNQHGKSVFRNLLLGKCQRFFEAESKDTESRNQLEEKISNTEEGDAKEVLKATLADMLRKKKRRTLGNIRFIGELYKLDLLISKIMHYCVVQLFQTCKDSDSKDADTDEESLESLCKLLTTVGQKLDSGSSQDNQAGQIDVYYTKLKQIGGLEANQDGTLSNPPKRIKFMIMDLLDLRKDKWVPRVAHQGPKTKEEIHREAKLEEMNEKIRLQEYQQQRAEEQQRKMSLQVGPSGRPMQGQRKHTVPSRPSWQLDQAQQQQRGQRGAPDRRVQAAVASQATKVTEERRGAPTLSKHLDDGSGSLGPRRGAWGSGASAWSKGATGGARSQEGKTGMEGSRSGSRASSRESSQTRQQKERDRGRDKERSDAVFLVKSMTQASTADVLPPAQAQEPPPATLPGAAEQEPTTESLPVEPENLEVDDDKLRRNASEMIDELVSSTVLEEAVQCVADKACQADRVFHHCLFHVMEKKRQHRLELGKLMYTVVSKNISPKDVVMKSFCTFLSEAVAYGLDQDVPKAWEYLGEVLGKVLSLSRHDNLFVLTDFRELIRDASGEYADLVLAHTLMAVKDDQDGGRERLKEVVSGARLEDFLPNFAEDSERRERFFVKFEFLGPLFAPPSTSSADGEVEELSSQIQSISLKTGWQSTGVGNVSTPFSQKPPEDSSSLRPQYETNETGIMEAEEGACSSTAAPEGLPPAGSLDPILIELDRMVKDLSPRELLDWIEKNVKNEDLNCPSANFVCALMRSILSGVVSGSEEDCSVDEEKLRNFNVVLVRLVAGKQNLERVCLDMSCEAACKRDWPKNFLPIIFTVLSEINCVTVDTFVEWKLENEQRYGMLHLDAGMKQFYSSISREDKEGDLEENKEKII